jgi:quercetin dioxygenase-like cupin family protein
MKTKKYTDVEKIEAHGDGASGASLRWVLGPKDDMPNFHMRVVEIEPGGVSMHHQHNYEHECFILEGQGELVGQGKSLPLQPGMAAFVPPNEIHQFRNAGDTTFKFLCMIPRLEQK